MQVSENIYSMKEENKEFLDWMNSLEQYERVFITNQIIRSCNVSRATVYTWKKGERKIKLPYQRIINVLAGRQIFDVPPINKNQVSL